MPLEDVDLIESMVPKLSIGMPVYNSEDIIHNAIKSILNQTFTDFELIISDNHSTDGTASICKGYALADSRIKLIRQPVNMGGEANFKFVLDQAKGEYFTWVASDDMRTEGFLGKNIDFLEKNLDYSFSCAPNCFIGEENDPEKLKAFCIEGSLYERLYSFLDFGIISHGCFYSVFRRKMLTDHTIAINPTHFAFDWSVNLHLLSKGKFGRIKDEKLILGFGVSTKPDFFATMGNNWIENVFPFAEFSKRFIISVRQNHELNTSEKLSIISKIYRFNMLIASSQIKVKIFRPMSKVKRFLLGSKK